MVIKSKKRAPIGSAATASKISLADVLLALNGQKTVSETRLRDLRSSVKRMALLLEDDPARILLDLPAISVKLAAITPAVSGLTTKTFANIRANFMAAVKTSGLKTVQASTRIPLAPAWKKLFAKAFGTARAYRFVAFGSLCECQRHRTRRDQRLDHRRLYRRGP